MSNFTTDAGAPPSAAIPDSSDDYYAMLGVPRDALKDQIKAAFKRLAITFHPDKFQDLEQRDAAQARFQELKMAYDILMNDTLRAIYDDFGAEAVKKHATMQLDRPIQSNADFLRSLLRQRRVQHQSYIMRRVNNVGSFTLMVRPKSADGSPWRPALGTLSVSQGVHFPLSETTQVQVGYTGLMNAGAGQGTVKLGISQHILSWSAMCFSNVRFGWNGWSVKMGGRKAILAGQSLIAANIAFSRDEPTGALVLSYMRAIHTNINGEISVRLGARPKLEISIAKEEASKEAGNFAWNSSLSVKSADLNLKGIFRYLWSDRTVITLEGGVGSETRWKQGTRILLMRSHFYAAGQIERTISQLTRAQVSWTISQYGVAVTAGFTRYGQTFSVPVFLNFAPTIGSSLIAIGAPFLACFLLEALLLEPRRRQKQLAQEEKRRRQQEAIIAAAKERALADCRLMAEEVNRKREVEMEKGGLVILQAFYGRYPEAPSDSPNIEDEDMSDRVDVTLPLQYMVQNSQLQIPAGTTKSALIGFYDPIPDEDKWIEVVYLFRHQTHRVLLRDQDALRMPVKSHQIPMD